MGFTTEISSELAVFEETVIGDAILSKSLEPKHPVTSITDNVNAPIDFLIDGNDFAIRPSGCFIALNISLTGLLTKHIAATSTNPATATTKEVSRADVKCAQINNIAHSLFSKITTYLEGREVSTISNYHLGAFLNVLLNFPESTLDTYARLCGWYKDVPGAMDSTDSAVGALKKRKSWFNADGSLDLIFCPFSPVLMSDKIIIPKTSLGLRLDRVTNPAFYLQYPNPAADESVNYKINVNSAIFYAQRLELTPEYIVGLERMLKIERVPVIYQMTEPQILTFNVPPQLRNFNVNNLFHGSIPEKILVMFVSAKAFNGDNTLNPFNFQNADVTRIGLYKRGIPFPHPPVDAVFGSKQCALAYHTTLTALQAPSPAGPCLTIDEFISGTAIFAFDTAPDASGAIQLSTLANPSSDIRLEVTFGTAPAEALVCLVYYERELRISADVDRNITVETLF